MEQKMQLKESVVLFPMGGLSHLLPMVELAKLFILQNFSVAVAVVVVDPPFDTSVTTDPFISRVSSDYPSISFHRLPKVIPPPSSSPGLVVLLDSPRLANPHLRDFLSSRKSTCNDRALVVDMFCSAALDVADELGLPSYFFYTSGAFALAASLTIPTLRSQGRFKDLDINGLVNLPGLPPFLASDLPPSSLFSTDEEIEPVFSHFLRLWRAKGIMVNTFEWLEKSAIESLIHGECTVSGWTVPPVYCIGPLVASGRYGGGRHGCLTWLDGQPEKSVVFLCFGTLGTFSVEQLKEMAIGLERSRQRFLWVVRSPTADRAKPGPEPDLEGLFPEGFLARTQGRGMVVNSWAPQGEVLGHKSIGAFVSHCGWNSSLEAVNAGVLVVAWPMYAEQRLNKVVLVEEAKVAVAMEGYDKELVTAEEVETKIRWLMESEEGKAMRDRASEAKVEAMAAPKEGGSSDKAWLQLVRAVRMDGPRTI